MRPVAARTAIVGGASRHRVNEALRASWEFARVKPLGGISAGVLLTAILIALVGPYIVPHDPLTTHIGMRNTPPSPSFLLGTDMFGRDVLARMVAGARVSLLVGLAAAALGVFGGGLLGVMGAYVGGAVDMILQRVVDILMSFPTLILAIALVAVLGAGLDKVIFATAIINAARAVRVLRSSALSVKEMMYIDSARALGASNLRIAFRHILPNTTAVFIVLFSVVFGSAIIVEASLSYLGLGVPPPISSWGGMLTNAQRYIISAPWVVLAAGLPIILVVLASNLLGDALRDYLDPRLRTAEGGVRRAR